MPGVFISYRRDDARAWTIVVRDHLMSTFGSGHVFLDLDSMEPGKWWPQIETALAQCAVVLVMIGPRWAASANADGSRRLWEADDLHRREVATALARPGVTVIPVLVDGARLPGAAELPADLQGLLDRQASEIGDVHERRVADLRRLSRTIDAVIGHGRERRRAVTAVWTVVALGVANTLVPSGSRAVGLVFLLASAGAGVLSWGVYRRMARAQMKDAWIGFLAAVLAGAMVTGSVIRLAVRASDAAKVSLHGR